MSVTTVRDLTGVSRDKLIERILRHDEERAFYDRRHKEILGRCNELLEEARAARRELTLVFAPDAPDVKRDGTEDV